MSSRSSGGPAVFIMVAALLLGACASAPTVSGPSKVDTSPEPTAVAREVSPTATQQPTFTEEDPLVVLLIGDSVTYEMAPAITEALESTGVVDVVENTQFGFALSLSQLNGWRQNWPGVLNGTAPDIVVIQTGTWDIDDNVQAAGRSPSPDSPTWEQEFRVLLDEATFVLSIADADILWMSMLPGPDPASAGRLNTQVELLGERNPFVTYVDVASPLRAPDGTMIMSEPDGAPLRKPDGIHLCVTGAQLATAELLAEIEARYGIAVSPDWVSGQWRSDGRYDVNPCADRASVNS